MENIKFNKLDTTEEVLETTVEATEEVLEAEEVEPVIEVPKVEEKVETVKKPVLPTNKSTKKEAIVETPKNVAVYSERNLYKYELGELLKGYSILPSAKAAKWVASTKKVRIATPEEVARYYNK